MNPEKDRQIRMLQARIRDLEQENETFEADAIKANKKLVCRDAQLAELEENINTAVEAVIDMIPAECVVRVCEGGGPEDLSASLAVSVSKLVQQYRKEKSITFETYDDFKTTGKFDNEPEVREFIGEVPDCPTCGGHGEYDTEFGPKGCMACNSRCIPYIDAEGVRRYLDWGETLIKAADGTLSKKSE